MASKPMTVKSKRTLTYDRCSSVERSPCSRPQGQLRAFDLCHIRFEMTACEGQPLGVAKASW
ncbi:MAG TPA: 30S ribosomal protein S14 [Deltaproteobacteria bacterium]|nr:30S ribosomal protein S14 [Deltaproteobacteria bacterium]